MHMFMFLFLILCQLMTTSCQVKKSQANQESVGQKIDVRVYYIRHGLSCGNIASYYAELTLQDPALTESGLDNSHKVGGLFHDYLKQQNINLDFVGSSPLMRAKQTLLQMLPQEIEANGDNLYEVAYLGENTDFIPKAWQLSNKPEDVSVQEQKLARYFPNMIRHKMNLTYSEGAIRDEVNYDLFRTSTLPKIIKDLRDKNEKTTYHMAIVTHSVTMKDELNCVRNPQEFFGELPTNNEIYYIDYSYDLGNQTTLLAESSCVRAIAVEPSYKGNNDVASCNRLIDPSRKKAN